MTITLNGQVRSAPESTSAANVMIVLLREVVTLTGAWLYLGAL